MNQPVDVISESLKNTEMKDSKAPLFSIFTATYNRKDLLPRAYESVKKQTFRDFEWVIIDDGSKDGTGEMVKQWQAEANFPIIYKWQSNGGKHTAFNAVSEIARGEFVLSLDSDDEMVPETLERYKFHWESLSPEQQRQIGCIMCLVKDQNGQIVGESFPKDKEIVDFWELYLARHVRGEKGAALVSKVYRMYLYPENIRNVYMPEGIFLHKMSKEWKTYCVNEVLRIYWTADERDDHDGDRMKTKANYPGNQLYHLAFINYSMRLFWKAPRIFLANAVYYVKLSFHLGHGIRKQFRSITNFNARLLWFFSLPMGYILYLRDRKK
jgi:glycosyltransferase involved in cell wall biosynthesis